MISQVRLVAALTLAAAWGVAGQAAAQDDGGYSEERIVVTGSRIPDVPAVTLDRRADFLLLEVRLLNDSLERRRRLQELSQTLDNLLVAAEADPLISVSVIDEEGYVLPVDRETPRLSITDDRSRRDTSVMALRLRAPIASDTEKGHDLAARIRSFVDGIETVGRTLVDVDGDIDLSIVQPQQYRRPIIDLIADDIAYVTGRLGKGSRAQVYGLNREVKWVRAGPLEVSLYISYDYVIIPDTLESTTIVQYE